MSSNVKTSGTYGTLPNWSANCAFGGGFDGDWLVTCPALNAKKITFDGGYGSDDFINDTVLP